MNCKTLLTVIKHLRIYSSLSTFSVMLRPLLERHLFHWSLVFIVISAKINISSYFKHVFSSGSKDECTFSIIQNKYYTGYGPWSSGLWGINRDCFEKCIRRLTIGCRIAQSFISISCSRKPSAFESPSPPKKKTVPHSADFVSYCLIWTLPFVSSKVFYTLQCN